MTHQRTPRTQAPEPTQAPALASGSPDPESLVESLHETLLRYAAESEAGPEPALGGAPEVRMATVERFRGFLEWLLLRCLGELAPPLKAPVFLGESERKLILDTADRIGREVLGATPAAPGGSVVVRLVLDRCSGAPCTGPAGARSCPGPDGGPRRRGEIGHFCLDGSLRR